MKKNNIDIEYEILKMIRHTKTETLKKILWNALRREHKKNKRG